MMKIKNSSLTKHTCLRLKGILLIFLSFIFVEQLFGQATPTVTITGPDTVCPNNFYPNGTIGNTYTATAKLWGQNIDCSNWQWIISESGFSIASGLGNTISNYAFPDVGTYRIQFFTTCGPIPI
jgi:hypothetical protein